MRPFIIGITGGSGSGKTYIAEALLNKMGRHNAVLIQQDCYYRDLGNIPFKKRSKRNFDHPSALELELFENHLRSLIAKKAIDVPVYDYITHTRKQITKRVVPKKIIIVEGNFLLISNRLKDLIDFKIYINADRDIRFIRRLKRDINERKRTVISVIKQYLNSVRKMHLEFVEPSKAYADLAVNTNDGSEKAIEIVWDAVKCHISEGQYDR